MGAYESPEAAYRAFLDTFNARDADGWAEVNNWPHARISAASDSEAHWRPSRYVMAETARIFHPPSPSATRNDWWKESSPRVIDCDSVTPFCPAAMTSAV